MTTPPRCRDKVMVYLFYLDSACVAVGVESGIWGVILVTVQLGNQSVVSSLEGSWGNPTQGCSPWMSSLQVTGQQVMYGTGRTALTTAS